MTIGSEGLLIVPTLSGDMMLVGWEVLREVQAVAVVGEVVLEGFHSPVAEAKLA